MGVASPISPATVPLSPAFQPFAGPPERHVATPKSSSLFRVATRRRKGESRNGQISARAIDSPARAGRREPIAVFGASSIVDRPGRRGRGDGERPAVVGSGWIGRLRGAGGGPPAATIVIFSVVSAGFSLERRCCHKPIPRFGGRDKTRWNRGEVHINPGLHVLAVDEVVGLRLDVR